MGKNKIVRICFFGTFGKQFDLMTVINAFKILKEKSFNDVELILCGSGDKELALKKAAKDLENVIFPGYLDQNEIIGLMHKCNVGICPYVLNEAFLSSIPGKSIEYMYGGLEILTNLRGGKLGNFLNKNNFGFLLLQQ